MTKWLEWSEQRAAGRNWDFGFGLRRGHWRVLKGARCHSLAYVLKGSLSLHVEQSWGIENVKQDWF